jgi:hypothetical protein
MDDGESLLSRRALLARALQLSAVGAVSTASLGCSSGPAALCADPAKLSDAENSLRASVRYTEKTPRSDQSCATCGFFASSAADPACGQCALLKGPVNSRGYCDSWSASSK